MSKFVVGVTGTKKNQKEERGRGNEAYIDDESILPSSSQEETNDSAISKQMHRDTSASYQVDQTSGVTDVKVTIVDDVEQETSSADEVDDTTQQSEAPPRSDAQSSVRSETEKTESGQYQDHEEVIRADHGVDENGEQQAPNAEDNRDPENNQKRSESTSLNQQFANHAVAVICLLLCVSACLVNIASIFLTVSCLWGLSPDVSDGNVVYSKGNNTITCDPYESQENIPYNLIDLLLALQPIVVIVLWKYGGIAERIEKYEEKGDYEEAKKDQYYRRRRTGYFVMITIALFFLLHCVECATCSFSSPTIFFGTLVRGVPKSVCPWLSLLFHLVFPGYCLYCWYATKMACVLRRRAYYIRKYIQSGKSSTIFDENVGRPDIIRRKLNDNIFHDKWHSEVWENISFLMNIMMFFSATLVLLYTHVYVSEVRLTLGEWTTHFMRLVSIATLSVVPYIHVAFACVRVTEAYSYIAESMGGAFQESYSHTSIQESHENSLDISQEPAGLDGRTCPSTQNRDGENTSLERLEYLIQWQFLQSKVYKKCKDGLTSGILGSSYTTRSGVHLASLGVIIAMTWEVLDRLNDFDVERAIALGNTRQEAFIVTLFGVLAFLLWISAASILLCYRLTHKICDCTKCFAPHAVNRRLIVYIVLTILYFLGINSASFRLCCWYATNMACVLRRRAKKIKEKSEQLFGSDNQTKDPRAILKELYKDLLYDTWGDKVWKNISFVMNIMMYIAVILVLLYTHVYISEVELTLGQWFSHFMRLLTIASLALTPYMHVAFACVRVTEAFKKMSEKSIEAERKDYHTDSKHNDHIADYESRDSDHVDMGDIAVQCGIPSEREKRADRIKNRVQVTKAMKARRNDLTFEDSHTNQSAKSEEVKIAIEIKEIVQSSERRAQWARLIKEIAKAQDTVLYNGILSSLYTTRNGVHWTMLGMVGAVAWEVLDHLNAFDESKVSDTSKERFMVALFGALALAAGMSGVLFVLFWQICGCCGCGNVPFKKTCCTNLSYKTGETDKTKTKICLVAFATLILWSTIYTCFYFAVSEDNDCTMELNPLVT
uniref:Uncharacterized protein n=1 Tax=Branchiostoma floridae TaxID=7739 RepID=C3Z5D3_BRAFL|eukprot:XP_002596034.1 hypothetical protein BRAFLDRAFT_66235 [Branchiostoma floridae]